MKLNIDKLFSSLQCRKLCLFVEVLWPSHLMGSCRARPIFLTTPLLGRLSPLSG